MNVLHAIASAQFIPTTPIYFELTCRLSFNNTSLIIQHLKYRGMQGRLLFQQLGTNSHVVVAHGLDKVTLADDTFTQCVTLLLIDAKQLTQDELPDIAYPPLTV